MHWFNRLGLLFLVALAGCHPVERQAPVTSAGGTRSGTTLRELRPLDQAHASDFQDVFNSNAERPRYIVAFSPT